MGGPSARGRGRDPPGGSRRSGVWGSWAEGGRHSFMSGVVGPRCFFNPAPARRGEVPCGPSALCLPAVWGAEAFAAWQPSRSCSTTRQSAAASAGNPRPDARLPPWRGPPTAKATAGPRQRCGRPASLLGPRRPRPSSRGSERHQPFQGKPRKRDPLCPPRKAQRCRCPGHIPEGEGGPGAPVLAWLLGRVGTPALLRSVGVAIPHRTDLGSWGHWTL